MSRPMKPKRGGKRPGSGRKAGSINKVTADLKGMARQYSVQALTILTELMQDPEVPPAARIQAAREVLDRGYGKPPVHIEPTHLNITPIPWEELRKIREQSMERAAQRHKEIVEGRYERLGISREYQTD